MEDARFYAISTAFPEFSNEDKPLVVQYSVKHEQNIDCGGAYVKLFPKGVDQQKLHGGEGEDVYNIMFGPDICGYTKRTHFILNYKSTNHLIKNDVQCKGDQVRTRGSAADKRAAAGQSYATGRVMSSSRRVLDELPQTGARPELTRRPPTRRLPSPGTACRAADARVHADPAAGPHL
jgi:hypothetical protein